MTQGESTLVSRIDLRIMSLLHFFVPHTGTCKSRYLRYLWVTRYITFWGAGGALLHLNMTWYLELMAGRTCESREFAF
jgi:hypothetical protein